MYRGLRTAVAPAGEAGGGWGGLGKGHTAMWGLRPHQSGHTFHTLSPPFMPHIPHFDHTSQSNNSKLSPHHSWEKTTLRLHQLGIGGEGYQGI